MSDNTYFDFTCEKEQRISEGSPLLYSHSLQRAQECASAPACVETSQSHCYLESQKHKQQPHTLTNLSDKYKAASVLP